MDTAITIVAIVVPAIVAAAAIVFGWLQHNARLAQDRWLVDLEAVRGVPDEAAVALHRVAYALDDVRSDLIQRQGVIFFKTDEGTERYKKLGLLGEECDVLLERLSVRLGAITKS